MCDRSVWSVLAAPPRLTPDAGAAFQALKPVTASWPISVAPRVSLCLFVPAEVSVSGTPLDYDRCSF